MAEIHLFLKSGCPKPGERASLCDSRGVVSTETLCLNYADIHPFPSERDECGAWF